MKKNIPIITAILFITLSIWLSFTIKKTNETLYRAETQIKAMERELSVSKYQLGILQEALELNIGKAPIPTRQTTLSRQTSNHCVVTTSVDWGKKLKVIN